ncbi:GD19762 [Drosophila simulans]|uniref:GD19762 n=1 Tax=Drosophila simulans TaxID=7240 RepID=B4QW77_DROSI|nr:GD19762 [Drosophila simulans]
MPSPSGMSWRQAERGAGGAPGGRGAGILAGSGRSPGTASILLAFLAAVSFRGMRALAAPSSEVRCYRDYMAKVPRCQDAKMPRCQDHGRPKMASRS